MKTKMTSNLSRAFLLTMCMLLSIYSSMTTASSSQLEELFGSPSAVYHPLVHEIPTIRSQEPSGKGILLDLGFVTVPTPVSVDLDLGVKPAEVAEYAGELAGSLTAATTVTIKSTLSETATSAYNVPNKIIELSEYVGDSFVIFQTFLTGLVYYLLLKPGFIFHGLTVFAFQMMTSVYSNLPLSLADWVENAKKIYLLTVVITIGINTAYASVNEITTSKPKLIAWLLVIAQIYGLGYFEASDELRTELGVTETLSHSSTIASLLTATVVIFSSVIGDDRKRLEKHVNDLNNMYGTPEQQEEFLETLMTSDGTTTPGTIVNLPGSSQPGEQPIDEDMLRAVSESLHVSTVEGRRILSETPPGPPEPMTPSGPPEPVTPFGPELETPFGPTKGQSCGYYYYRLHPIFDLTRGSQSSLFATAKYVQTIVTFSYLFLYFTGMSSPLSPNSKIWHELQNHSSMIPPCWFLLVTVLPFEALILADTVQEYYREEELNKGKPNLSSFLKVQIVFVKFITKNIFAVIETVLFLLSFVSERATFAIGQLHIEPTSIRIISSFGDSLDAFHDSIDMLRCKACSLKNLPDYDDVRSKSAQSKTFFLIFIGVYTLGYVAHHFVYDSIISSYWATTWSQIANQSIHLSSIQ